MRMHLLWKTICKLSSDRKTFAGFCKGKQNAIKFKCVSENTRAIHFYQREGFEIQNEGLDEATGEKDYVMTWR